MTPAGCILVVDDDAAIREMLAEYLTSHGFEVVLAGDGAAMRTQIEAALPDLVLLDLRLPQEDGLSLARYLRERYDIGIIMVTGAAGTVDRIVGLEMGADDYVAKPFEPRELLARIKSVLRRLQARPVTPAVVDGPASHVAFGHCRLDVGSHRLFGSDGVEVPITTMEFELLKLFSEHPGKVLSRDRILTLTKNREWDPYDRSIDIRVARLRRKIEKDPENPQVIRTVRGAGYMFVSAV